MLRLHFTAVWSKKRSIQDNKLTYAIIARCKWEESTTKCRLQLEIAIMYSSVF